MAMEKSFVTVALSLLLITSPGFAHQGGADDDDMMGYGMMGQGRMHAGTTGPGMMMGAGMMGRGMTNGGMMGPGMMNGPGMMGGSGLSADAYLERQQWLDKTAQTRRELWMLQFDLREAQRTNQPREKVVELMRQIQEKQEALEESEP
ncbi:hypothetical protein QQM79_14625 [Marinobacteraceae bacterium S3BR75-40.1]